MIEVIQVRFHTSSFRVSAFHTKGHVAGRIFPSFVHRWRCCCLSRFVVDLPCVRSENWLRFRG